MHNDHIEKVNQAILYIHTHLDRTLSLQEVAEVVSFSRYHFHRVFVLVTRETLHSYVKRVRLESAAQHLLRYTEVSITDIASRFGFSSLSNFCRAFQQKYGTSPSSYRKLGKNTAMVKPVLFETEQPKTSAKIEVCTLPSWHVAYKRLRTAWGGTFNAKVMSAFDDVARWCQRRYTAGDIGISIMCSVEDNWQRLPDALTYDACVVVPRLVQHTEQEIKTQHLPGGLYAVCQIEKQAGAPSAFAEAIREMTWMSEYMYIHWIPNNGFQLDDKPGMHIFYTEPTSETIAMSCCLPVSPITE